MTLSQETELLKQRIAAIQESTAKDNGEQSRLEQIQAIISERESKCMEYDDSIVRQMVECIKVYPGGKLVHGQLQRTYQVSPDLPLSAANE